MDCPLPIDWLDYLEQGDDDANVDLVAHLEGCRRCQLLIEDLRRQSVGVELDGYQGVALEMLKAFPRWREEERSEISVGDIWLTRGEFDDAYADLPRQIVLVIGEREEFDKRWLSVAPLTTETETATNSDLLLSVDDTTLEVPLAVQFRAQTPLLKEQLASYLGTTTESGRELLAGALAGTLERGRFGAGIASALDRRLRRIEETRELMVTLARVYSDALSQAELAAEQAGEGATHVHEASSESWGLRLVGAEKEWPVETDEAGVGQVLVFLSRVKAPTEPGVLAWAASTVRPSNRLIDHFAFVSGSRELRARLELKVRGEEMLLLFIEAVSGFSSSPVSISFAKPNGERVDSPPFEPAAGAEVVVARGSVGVAPSELDQLELRLS